MKLRKKLSKKIIIFFLLLIFPFNSFSQTKDIWQKSKELKIEKKESTPNNSDNKNQNNSDLPPTVFDKENTDLKIGEVTQSSEIQDNEIIFGLYEPDSTKINLNFWADIEPELYSQLMASLLETNNKGLSKVAEKILFTKTNISVFEDKGKLHLENIANWLIKNQKMVLIDKVIYQNDMINQNSKFLEFLFNYYLTIGQVDKACTYANLITINSDSSELEKYKIFCLVNDKKNKQALTQLDLTKETNKIDNFFINKINFLTGISDNKGEINFDNVFNSHLTLLVNKDHDIKLDNFSKTKSLRNYFFKSGLDKKLLDEARENSSPENKSELNELIIFLERSANEDLYESNKILDIYKKYSFSFEQLFKPLEASKNLKRPESHAILYQGMLLAQDPKIKLNILSDFKNKLELNGLSKVVKPIFYQELKKIHNKDAELISEQLLKEIEIFEKEQNADENYNFNYLSSSKVRQLINNNLDKDLKKEAISQLYLFENKVKNKEYNLNNKDKALLNILHQNNVEIPGSFKKDLFTKDIYIPNDIFNSLEKDERDEALLKSLIFISKLNDKDQTYVRDVLSIVKIFDKLDLSEFKEIYLNGELNI